MSLAAKKMLLGSLACALLIVACSDDDGAKTDGAVTQQDGAAPGVCEAKIGASEACGGELVGDWVFEQVCIDPSVVIGAIQVVCPTASGANFDIKTLSGATLSFTATDYDIDARTDVSFDLDVPVECATTLGGCAMIQTMVQSGFTANGLAGSVACAESSGGCACALAFTYDVQGTGSYSAASGVVTLSDGAEYYYCVADGKLTWSGVAGKVKDEAAGYVLAPAP